MIDSTAVKTDALIRALLDDWHALPEEFRASSPDAERVWLPKRYGVAMSRKHGNEKTEERSYGGLLFGQFIPRFDNRLISVCPFTFAKHYQRLLQDGLTQEEWERMAKKTREKIKPRQPLSEERARHFAEHWAKVPSKASREFLDFRWVSLLVDLTVQPKGGGAPRSLSDKERQAVDAAMHKKGVLSRAGLAAALADAAPGCEAANLEDIFAETPERERELYVDPARAFAAHSELAQELFPILPERLCKRVLNELQRGHKLKVGDLESLLRKFGYHEDAERFAGKVQWLQDAESLKATKGKRGKGRFEKSKKPKPVVPIAERILPFHPLQGRARYHRDILKQATAEILAGFDPTKKARDPKNPAAGGEDKPIDGCRVETPEMRLLTLGLRLKGENAEDSYAAWLALWRAKRSRTGKAANEDAYQRRGDTYARRIFDMRQMDRWLGGQTNNHLVRQRLLLLRRLTDDLIAEHCPDEPERIGGVSIEVTRDLLAFSGMKKQDIGSDTKGALKSIKAQHYRVKKWLEKHLVPEGYGHLITGKLLWKAKIADDLGYKCPYTQQPICPLDLALGRMDVDHIIPRSQRLTDAMEACVITYKEINLKKKNLTAYQFVKKFQRERIGALGCEIKPLEDYLRFVEALKECRPPKGKTDLATTETPTAAGDAEGSGSGDLNPRTLPGSDRLHPDYIRRRKRKRLLKLKRAPELTEGFTQRDLTVTGHLNRLAQTTLLRALPHLEPHHFTSLPGVVTGRMRDLRGWGLLGVLGHKDVCGEEVMRTVPVTDPETKKQALDADGNPRTKVIPKPKAAIRAITQLHHALDAATIGILSHVLPRDGKLWEYLALRDLTDEQAKDFRRRTDEHSANGHPFKTFFTLLPIPMDEREPVDDDGKKAPPPRTLRVVSNWSDDNKKRLSVMREGLAQALAGKRVRQHIPAELQGMPTDQTVYRALASLDGKDGITQLARRVVAEKELELARLDAQLARIADKEIRKPLQVRREALAKSIGKLRDFNRNVWLIHRIRVESLSGKDVLKKLTEWQVWKKRSDGSDIAPGEEENAEDQTETPGGEADTEEPSADGKKKRAPRKPMLLREYAPDRHRLLLLYDVVARDRVIGLKPAGAPDQAKLTPMKAAKALSENFAAAIFPGRPSPDGPVWEDDSNLFVIPYNKVWHELEAMRQRFHGQRCQLVRKGTLIQVPKGNFKSCWRVVSVKRTEAFGIALSLVKPDAVELGKGGKGNAPLRTLLADGMQIIPNTLAGHDIRQTLGPGTE